MVDTWILFELLLSDFYIKCSSTCPLEDKFLISFSHLAKLVTRSAQLYSDGLAVRSKHCRTCVWCFREKIVLLLRKSNYLVDFMRI